MITLYCITCSAPISYAGIGGAPLRCPPCRKEYKRKYHRNNMRKWRADKKAKKLAATT